LPSAEQREIMEAVKSQHYHVACTRLFELTHRDQGVKKGDGIGPGGESVSHPNLYTERSRQLESGAAVEVKMEVD
jgi:DNA primase large subunit